MSADAAGSCAVLVETSADGCSAAQLAHAMATRSRRNISAADVGERAKMTATLAFSLKVDRARGEV